MRKIFINLVWRSKLGEWLGDLGVEIRNKQVADMFEDMGMVIDDSATMSKRD